VFGLIIEYSSLMDFGPYLIGLFLYDDFWKMIFWLVLKLEINYRVIISWRILGFFRGFFEDYIFAWWNIWVFIILSFALRYLLIVNGNATVWHTPCLWFNYPQCIHPSAAQTLTLTLVLALRFFARSEIFDTGFQAHASRAPIRLFFFFFFFFFFLW
jgi:hypothetical protein